MDYGEKQAAVNAGYGNSLAQQGGVPTSSLVADSGNIVERLQTIHNHLIELGNKLHGSQPRDAGATTGKIEPEPTLRRNLDKAGSWLTDIEHELQRVSARL